jgi:hypothetical protein
MAFQSLGQRLVANVPTFLVIAIAQGVMLMNAGSALAIRHTKLADARGILPSRRPTFCQS